MPAPRARRATQIALDSSTAKTATAERVADSLTLRKPCQSHIAACEIEQLGGSVKLGSARPPRFSELLPTAGSREIVRLENHVSLGFFRLFSLFTDPSCQQC
jgi:hypothetical protein